MPESTQSEVLPSLLPGMKDAVGAGRAKARATRARKAAAVEITSAEPVARVLVDLPLAHLDRPFDYAVPSAMAVEARAGVRVKVRFAGKDLDGYVVSRGDTTDHNGRLTPIKRLVSPEPVLAPQVAVLAERLAVRYAGTRSDVLRLAVPPRHATTEHEPTPLTPAPQVDLDAARAAWATYPAADAFLGHLRSGTPRAVWGAVPGEDWPRLLAEAAAVALAAGRGTLICVPDRRDVARVDAALTSTLGRDQHAVLTAEGGPARRYRAFLSVSRGACKVVVGTRAAAFAPVHDLGLVVIWDDGDDLFDEPRAPYPHTRDVLLARAHGEGTAALLGGFARSTQAQQLVDNGWAHELAPDRVVVRDRLRVTIAGAAEVDLRQDAHARSARIPKQAHDLIEAGLATGPVLVQTPRGGYVAALACERCRTPARCATCAGPLRLADASEPPGCRWCGAAAPGWRCGECGHRGLRAPVIGQARTAEELGHSFPGARIVPSAGDHIVAVVPDRPAIVVATPGGEPVAEGGYAAVVLLDTWLMLGLSDLDGESEAVRRWANAAGLVRAGGRVLAVGDPALPALQALVRWDHAGWAVRAAAEQASAGLPPGTRLATVTGSAGALADALTLLDPPPSADVLGPVTDPGAHLQRVVVRVPAADGALLAAALTELQRIRSARKLEPVRIQLDPGTLG